MKLEELTELSRLPPPETHHGSLMTVSVCSSTGDFTLSAHDMNGSKITSASRLRYMTKNTSSILIPTSMTLLSGQTLRLRQE